MYQNVYSYSKNIFSSYQISYDENPLDMKNLIVKMVCKKGVSYVKNVN